MPAYFVAIRDKTKDPSALETYGKEAQAASAGHKMIPRALYGRQVHLEGPPAEGIVILEFPSVEAAEAWYHSPAYQKAMVHRQRGADYRVYIVDGLPG
jgi:uncharacterized protein (DUF1330 family)